MYMATSYSTLCVVLLVLILNIDFSESFIINQILNLNHTSLKMLGVK